MAVDLYVGSISRYLAGDWQTENQQLLAKAGAPDLVQVWHMDGRKPLGREEALQRAVEWRDRTIAEAQREDSGLRGPITPWQEDLDSPYAVKRLSAGGIGAVTLTLFYEDLKDLPSPVPEPLLSDPRVAAKQDNLNLALAATGLGCDLWLPGDFVLLDDLDWPRFTDGSKATVGGLEFLKAMLDGIEASWPSVPEQLRAFAARNTALPAPETRGVWPFRKTVETQRESTLLLAIQTLDRLKAMTALALERNQPMIRDC